MNILVVEDEKPLRSAIRAFLERDGYRAFEAGTVGEAETLIDSTVFDCAVLDWMLPDGDGATFCSELKLHSGMKILMLTAKTGNDDEYAALEAGADDYLRKPFDPRILAIRIGKLVSGGHSLTIGPFTLLRDSRKALKDGKDLGLAKREWELFEYLSRKRGMILPRETIFSSVWADTPEADMRTVDTHVRRLRSKIGDEYITTRRGLGYSLEVGDA